MAQLKEDYCSYEVAKLLKEKGFDGICQCYWHNFYGLTPFNGKGDTYKTRPSFGVLVPTHQMAMKWLREIYNIIIMIDYNEDEDCEDNERFGFAIYQKNIRKVDLATYPTYEEAVEAALKYYLTNLI